MTKKFTCIGSPDRCFEYFEEHFKTFGSIVNVTSFFDSENFIFTGYSMQNDCTHTVIENVNHDTIQLASIGCGFEGAEYQYTKKLLLKIGIPDELTEQCVASKGFQLILTENMKNVHARFDNLIFFHREYNNRGFKGFMVDAYSKVWLSGRKVFMINPQRNNFNGLLNCLYVMKPCSMDFYIGKHSPLGNGLTIEDTKSNVNDSFVFEKVSGAKDANLIINGELFRLVCFVDQEELPALVQTLYFFIFKKPIEDKFFYDQTLIYSKKSGCWKYLLSFIKWEILKKPKNYRNKIEINSEEFLKWH